MQTRLKFVCNREEKWQNGQDKENPYLYNYKFSVVNSYNSEATDDNKTFWKWTPSGEVSFSTVRTNQFEVGKSYYFTVTEAE